MPITTHVVPVESKADPRRWSRPRVDRRRIDDAPHYKQAYLGKSYFFRSPRRSPPEEGARGEVFPATSLRRMPATCKMVSSQSFFRMLNNWRIAAFVGSAAALPVRNQFTYSRVVRYLSPTYPSLFSCAAPLQHQMQGSASNRLSGRNTPLQADFPAVSFLPAHARPSTSSHAKRTKPLIHSDCAAALRERKIASTRASPMARTHSFTPKALARIHSSASCSTCLPSPRSA